MKKEDIVSKIKEQAYENVNKKIEEERKITEEKINSEIDVVEEILGYIANRMLFKTPTYGEYELVDEEMFFKDYAKEVDDWDKGVKINRERERGRDWFIKVNDEKYYDINYIISDYENTFNYYREKLTNLRSQFNNIEQKVEELKKQEPEIKTLIEKYKKVEVKKKNAKIKK